MIASLFHKMDYKNVTLKPFSYITPSIGSINIGVLLLLIPQIIMLVITKSYSSILILISSIFASFVAEGFYKIIEKNYNFSWITASIQGVIIGLLLPSNYPFIAVFFITLFTLLCAKYAFGAYTNSWINPMAITIAVAYFINMSVFPDFLLSSSDLQSRNSALILIQNGTIPLSSIDTLITAFLNKTVFKIAGINIPEGYISFFLDTHSVIPAFRFNFLTLISSIILISLDMVDVLIPACFIVIYSLLVKFLGPVFYNGINGQGDIILALLTSGTLFSTLFLLQYFGTTPITTWGKILYGILAGIIGFFIMGSGTSSAGYIFTVLIMNIISPVIQVFESRQTKNKIEKKIVPYINEMYEASHE